MNIKINTNYKGIQVRSSLDVYDHGGFVDYAFCTSFLYPILPDEVDGIAYHLKTILRNELKRVQKANDVIISYGSIFESVNYIEYIGQSQF